MRNKFTKLSMLLLAATIAFSSCKKDEDAPTPPAEVNVPDAKLKAYIKGELGLGENDKITVENILKLDTLAIAGEDDLTGELSGIADLTGLEAAKELVYVRFGGTAVTSLAPIAGLKKVQYLRFNNTAITDVSMLTGYTTLTYFNANTVTGLTSIAGLANNTGLKEMILRDVPMGNAGLQTIKNFLGLYRLNIRSTGVTDLIPLRDMMAQGALQDTTPGAMENGGGATLDLRGNTVDCKELDPYIANIANLDGC